MAVDDEMQILGEWCKQLASALQIPDLDVDQELLLDLARKSADSVIHAAAPVTSFMVVRLGRNAPSATLERASSEGGSVPTFPVLSSFSSAALSTPRAGSSAITL